MRRGDWPAQQPGEKSTVAWLVTLVRAGYGVGLVAAPGLLIGLTGQVPGRRACAVARVLGVRHLVQAGLTATAVEVAPGNSVPLVCGAAVDLVHAGSMFALGAVDSRVRRAALTDTAVEMTLAAVGAWAGAVTFISAVRFGTPE
jgi:hypothetical protein